tara:strand:+ start:312 stop:548 length:237 start_codon:yes stop_codon:yes gene_type:complete
MRRGRRNLIHYRNLTEDKKDEILQYIKEKEISIKQAAFDLKLTTSTIDKIFSERFGKRYKKTTELTLNNKKELHGIKN